MSGARILELKRRIRSIKNTQKITRAMGLVAGSKLRRVREKTARTGVHFESYKSSIEILFSNPEVQNLKYFKENHSDIELYIVITSDSGLSGSYNSNVINRALQEIHEKKIALITIGEKGRNYFTKRHYETLAEFVEVGDAPNIENSWEITSIAFEAFNEGKVRSINIVYTHFYSPLRQEVEILKLLPIEKSDKIKQHVLIEPSPEEVFNFLLPNYLKLSMYYAIINSICSEHAVRMRAMDNATKNASELLEKLQITFNRARQSSITQEITEIVSGAEALSD